MKQHIVELLKTMSLEQKASLCSGVDFWRLEGIEEHNIPSIMVTDGPHGLRKQSGKSDHVGLNDSVPATCFPTASALASSWDRDLLKEIGSALGEECRQEKVAVLLGPGLNIKRNPLCGRNFEYFSEDPYLGGRLASALICGVQEQGIGTSAKHYVANNQERRRMTVDMVVDDRALREIYLAGFEEAVKSSKPDTVMCAYNRLNGEYCSENSFLLKRVLREDWKYEGLVVTDWGAANDRVKGLEAGLDLEMPGNGGLNDRCIIEAVNSGELSMEVVDKAVERLLKLILQTSETLTADYKYDEDEHHLLARRAESEAAVLLKNENILPLDKDADVAVIGAFAKIPRYQGSGSSLINPTRLDNVWDALCEETDSGLTLTYAAGYDPESEEVDLKLVEEAVAAAKSSGVAVVFAGLPEVSESEGFDRATMDIPRGHTVLIEAVAEANPNVVVVLSNGAPVTMPWLGKVKAVLESYLGGQAWGPAVADILLGRLSPSGKLAETFPLSLDDDPTMPNFPGGTRSVAYAESIYVGYRYYGRAEKEVLFPFGYGMSYTTFEYSDLDVKNDGSASAEVSFTIKNTGEFEGKEIFQIYVCDVDSSVFRPGKELKGFGKVSLKPGGEKRCNLTLDRRAFAFWDSGNQDWAVEAGDFSIFVGASSADIRLSASVFINSGDELSSQVKDMKKLVPEYYGSQIGPFSDLSDEGPFARLLGRRVPPADHPKGTPVSRSSTVEEISEKLIGRIVNRVLKKSVKKVLGEHTDAKTLAMMEAMVREMPLRNLGMLGSYSIPMVMIDGLVSMLNGHFFKGLSQLSRGIREKNAGR